MNVNWASKRVLSTKEPLREPQNCFSCLPGVYSSWGCGEKNCKPQNWARERFITIFISFSKFFKASWLESAFTTPVHYVAVFLKKGTRMEEKFQLSIPWQQKQQNVLILCFLLGVQRESCERSLVNTNVFSAAKRRFLSVERRCLPTGS